MVTALSYLSLDQKGRATLPEEVRASLGLGPGDIVLLERTDRGTYELVPAALVPRDQLWFHHPAMQRRVRKAEASFGHAGQTPTRSPEEAQALLDRLKAPAKKRR
jgi:AbrB family looped-hinge helix DNA binding protein